LKDAQKTTDAEKFDFEAIEREFVREQSHSCTLKVAKAVENSEQKKAEAAFRRELKKFTSSTKPHHCLVKSIEITAPSAILEEGIVLIDTPGLGDTERFRVSLTERVVEDVDAILFLTKSGASYDQSEKDFLMGVLRKGTVRL
jgi:hypothetical protein